MLFRYRHRFDRRGEIAPRRHSVPDFIQIVLKSFSKSSIDCLSTPAAPALALTALKASDTNCLEMVNGFVVRNSFLLLPVERRIPPLDPTPLLPPHYQPASLLRVGPPQCSASVRLPRGFCHLCSSLGIRATGSRSSAREPRSDSRLLHAGRRLPSSQVPDRLVPRDRNTPDFDDNSLDYDASAEVH
jgi:hypothetical protein